MIKVPLYQENQDHVPLKPEYTETFIGSSTADSFGSGTARGLQSLADGLNTAAEAAHSVQQMRDDAVVSDSKNRWLQAKDQLLYDPDTGYANAQGRQAVDRFDAYQKDIQDLKHKFVSQMSSRQTEQFNKQIGFFEADALRTGLIKKSDETKKWLLQEHTTAAENFTQQAIQTPEDETRWNYFVEQGLSELNALGFKVGWSEQRMQLERQSYVSNVRLQSTFRLSESDPVKAARYAIDHMVEISPRDNRAILEKLKPDLTRVATEDMTHVSISNSVASQFAAQGLSDSQYKVLSILSGAEPHSYDTTNGDQHISDYSTYPEFAGNGGVTTLAGRYQLPKSSWERAAKALGLVDFFPASQDRAAAWLAQADYWSTTGRDLSTDIDNSDYAAIRSGLLATWDDLGKISYEELSSRIGTATAAHPTTSDEQTLNETTTSGGNALSPRFSQAFEDVLSGLPSLYVDEIRKSAVDGMHSITRQRALNEKTTQIVQSQSYKKRIADGDATLTVQDIYMDTVINVPEKVRLINDLVERNDGARETDANVEAFRNGNLVVDPYSDDGRKANDDVWNIISSNAEASQIEPLLLEQIRQTGAVPTSIGNRLRLQVTRGKTDGVREALDVGRQISIVDAGALARMPGGGELADDVVLYSYYLNDIGLEPDEAAQRTIDHKNPNERRRREDILRAHREYIDAQSKYIEVVKFFEDSRGIGDQFWSSNVMLGSYKEILAESIIDAGDDQIAGLKLANDRFKRRNGFSKFGIGGPKRLTYLPAEKTYPADIVGEHTYVETQLSEFLTAEGITYSNAYLVPDEDTENDVAANVAPRYQVYYRDANGELQHHTNSFSAKPPSREQLEAAKKVFDAKLVQMLLQYAEKREFQKNISNILAGPDAVRSSQRRGQAPKPESAVENSVFENIGPLHKTSRKVDGPHP